MSLFGRRQPEDTPSRDRSPEERERARLEREARRAARGGGPAPPPPPPAALRDDDPFDTPAPPPAADEPRGEDPFAAPPVDEPRFAAPPRDEPRVAPPPVEEPKGEDPLAAPRADDPFAEPPADDPLAEPPADDPLAEPPADDPLAEPPADGPVAEPLADDAFGEAAPAGRVDDVPGARSFAMDHPTVEFDVAADQRASVPPPPPAAPEVTEPEPAAETGDHTFSGWGPTGMTEDQSAAGPSGPPVVPPAPTARSPRFGDEHERPVPPKRVSRRTLPPPPPPPGEKPPRRGRGRKGRVVGILALLLIAGAAWLGNVIFQPFKGEGGEAVTVRVPTDSTANEVGDILAEKGIVDSGFVFTLRSRMSGASLQAGTYTLKKDSSYADAIDALKAGPPPPKVVRLTIPEGRSRREAQPVVRDAGLEGSYLKASEKPTSDFSPRRYGAPRGVASMEGFLFPATYELKPNATARSLVAKQLDAFRENIRGVSMRRARARNLTTYEVLVIASMVEREASLDKERRLISAVIHNRLREGMPLGIDATIRFATRNWSRPLRQSELEIDSPYNTRRRTGLPPGPIGSPGLASIKAAANPANVDHLYYVVKPGTCGEHSFSSSDAQFQRDVQAYKQAQERAGGKSPDTC